MKLLSIVVLSVLCTFSQAISFSTVATVSLTLISLNKPVSSFFGIFRRRKSPTIQEAVSPSEAQSPFSFPNQPMPGGWSPFGGGFGGGGFGGMFMPGFNPGFGMFGPGSNNRFPPQFKPPQQPMRSPQKPQIPPFPHQFNPQQSMNQFPQQSMNQFPPPQSPMHQFPPQNMPPAGMPPGMGSFQDPSEEDDVPGMNTEEAESFFTLLAETDESKCISRLVCEMGANPESGGEFGQTIAEIIGSLNDFPDGSKVSEYNEVFGLGAAEGLSACLSKFSACDEESYQLVKKAQLEDGQGD